MGRLSSSPDSWLLRTMAVMLGQTPSTVCLPLLGSRSLVRSELIAFPVFLSRLRGAERILCLHPRSIPGSGLVPGVASKGHGTLSCVWQWLSTGREVSGGKNSPPKRGRKEVGLPFVLANPRRLCPAGQTSADGARCVNGSGRKTSLRK